MMFLFFKQKTAYEMRISDWSSDVCSSDLDSLGVDQIVGQVIVDLAVGQLTAIFAQLDQDFQTVAARFLLFGSHLVTRGYVFVALAALAARSDERRVGKE